MKLARPRLAVRAAILRDDLLLMVNAYPDGGRELWALPGGGVEPGASLPDNLAREVHEETGLSVRVGVPILVNEFHDPESGWHQVELVFRAQIAGDATIDDSWEDPEKVVSRRRWVSRTELALLPHKPDSLADAVWGERAAIYDPLEPILR